jgi:hypothetical protein
MVDCKHLETVLLSLNPYPLDMKYKDYAYFNCITCESTIFRPEQEYSQSLRKTVIRQYKSNGYWIDCPKIIYEKKDKNEKINIG